MTIKLDWNTYELEEAIDYSAGELYDNIEVLREEADSYTNLGVDVPEQLLETIERLYELEEEYYGN